MNLNRIVYEAINDPFASLVDLTNAMSEILRAKEVLSEKILDFTCCLRSISLADLKASDGNAEARELTELHQAEQELVEIEREVELRIFSLDKAAFQCITSEREDVLGSFLSQRMNEITEANELLMEAARPVLRAASFGRKAIQALPSDQTRPIDTELEDIYASDSLKRIFVRRFIAHIGLDVPQANEIFPEKWHFDMQTLFGGDAEVVMRRMNGDPNEDA